MGACGLGTAGVCADISRRPWRFLSASCSVWEEEKRREGERRLEEEEKRGKPFYSPANNGEDI